MADLEDGFVRNRPCFEAGFSRFAAWKWRQDDKVEHYLLILKAEIYCSPYAY